MANLPSDPEIERIQRKKIAEMLQRATSVNVPSGKPIALTDTNFSFEIAKHKLIIVDFWAPWCGPCRMVGPLIEQLSEEYAGRVVFGKMNVDENMAVPSRFGVMSIPTIVVFKNGKAVETLIGSCPKSQIESKFKPYLEKGQ